MNKRIKKKKYKEIVRAKEIINDDLLKGIIDGYYPWVHGVHPSLAQALRRVLGAGELYRSFRDWSFFMPKTKDVIASHRRVIKISGKLYRGQKFLEDCPSGIIFVDPKNILRHEEYYNKIFAEELGEDFIRFLVADQLSEDFVQFL